jgi:hypothetical protein
MGSRIHKTGTYIKVCEALLLAFESLAKWEADCDGAEWDTNRQNSEQQKNSIGLCFIRIDSRSWTSIPFKFISFHFT